MGGLTASTSVVESDCIVGLAATHACGEALCSQSMTVVPAVFPLPLQVTPEFQVVNPVTQLYEASLPRKLTQVLRLPSEQLSSQRH
jgi:hypothetical protein